MYFIPINTLSSRFTNGEHLCDLQRERKYSPSYGSAMSDLGLNRKYCIPNLGTNDSRNQEYVQQ